MLSERNKDTTWKAFTLFAMNLHAIINNWKNANLLWKIISKTPELFHEPTHSYILPTRLQIESSVLIFDTFYLTLLCYIKFSFVKTHYLASVNIFKFNEVVTFHLECMLNVCFLLLWSCRMHFQVKIFNVHSCDNEDRPL